MVIVMDNIFDMHDFIGTSQGDQAHMLGKFLYFSLANLLVDKKELSKLCEDMGIPYSGGTRVSVGDAFRSATGDIRERVPVTAMGETNIYLAYCRDNKRTAEILSRELGIPYEEVTKSGKGSEINICRTKACKDFPSPREGE